jgi:hypothetical protein
MADTHNNRAAGWANTPLTRRELLLLGSAGVATTMLAGLSRLAPADLSPLLNLGSRITEPLSIGFWTADTNAATSLEIVGAQQLASGDARFLSDGARVSVFGLHPFNTPAAFAHMDAIDIDIAYAPYHDQAFRAWSFTNGTAPRMTSLTAVSIPVDAREGMTLNVAYRLAGASETTHAALRFTTGSESNVAKLREGIYLVALPDAARALPDWRTQRVTASDPTRGLSRHHWTLESATPARNPYIMLSVK